ncbi:hypothetical protein [Helicobacter cetorum]|uniref:Dynamin-like helical domain-containing protein n=1 Tax=Helicobacter cetorum (strain ATCC BAA-429 / MIT 00-7128) TaxID=182217 RepID=I0EMR9_HELC0|nr:hypothetical protein [Helicobacter cetorum]AFI04238.1 hypothetical protein HCW_04855 [Helicobacter cetorum MIT 00-7128]
MKESLGDFYNQHLVLSARVIFLSLANFLLDDNLKEKEKFLAHFSKEELLEKANFYAFSKFLQQDFITNTQEKINTVNRHKLITLIDKHLNKLEKGISTFKNSLQSFKNQIKESMQNLHSIAEKSQRDFDNSIDELLDNLETEIRDKMYHKIQEGIGKNDFKIYLENILKKHIDILNQQFKDIENIISNNLIATIQEELEKFNHYMNMIERRYSNLNISVNLNNFNMPNGINKAEFTLGTMSLVATILFGGPTAIIVLGVLSSEITIFKSISNYFSDDYKKSEQKKATNKAIEDFIKDIKKNKEVENFLITIKRKYINCAEEINQKFQTLLENQEETLSLFLKTKDLFEELKKKI